MAFLRFLVLCRSAIFLQILHQETFFALKDAHSGLEEEEKYISLT